MRYLVPLIFITCISFTSYSQIDIDFDEDPSFSDRIFFGGGLGFSTNNVATMIAVSPIAGYMITEKLSAGLGVQYQYINYKFFDLSVNNYGGNIFTRYNINQFFAQIEYNLMNMEIPTTADSDVRVYVDRLLIGGGISQPLGRRARVNIVGYYDVFYQPGATTQFYNSPWVFRVFVSG
ncbi:MAG: hypothetical protein ACNS60_17755 [Candidatus Cyclobacteriaceae bacterium M2_1C_046]